MACKAPSRGQTCGRWQLAWPLNSQAGPASNSRLGVWMQHLVTAMALDCQMPSLAVRTLLTFSYRSLDLRSVKLQRLWVLMFLVAQYDLFQGTMATGSQITIVSITIT